jgi:hypothetical protein
MVVRCRIGFLTPQRGVGADLLRGLCVEWQPTTREVPAGAGGQQDLGDPALTAAGISALAEVDGRPSMMIAKVDRAPLFPMWVQSRIS